MSRAVRRRSVLVFGGAASAALLSACGGGKPDPNAQATQAARIRATAYPETATPIAEPTQGESSMPAAKQWSKAPEMSIDTEKTYFATFRTDKGDIRVELLDDSAPVTVNNFVFLAREGFYDNTTFHRVLKDFMAQGTPPAPAPVARDTSSAMRLIARSRSTSPATWPWPTPAPGPTAATFVPTPWLNGKHTIFGKVVEGMDVALSLTLRDPQQRPKFAGDKLLTVVIEEQ